MRALDFVTARTLRGNWWAIAKRATSEPVTMVSISISPANKLIIPLIK